MSTAPAGATSAAAVSEQTSETKDDMKSGVEGITKPATTVLIPSVVKGSLYTDTTIKDTASVQEAVKKHPVFILSKTTCGFCSEAKRTLLEEGLNICSIEVDKDANGSAIRAAVSELSNNSNTVPQIFLNGSSVGGCDDLKVLQASGELAPKVEAALATQRAQAGVSAAEEEGGEAALTRGSSSSGPSAAGVFPGPSSAMYPLFFSPDFVDNRAVRLGGGLTMVIAILGVVFATKKQMIWTLLGLLVDYAMRFVAGGKGSPIALLAALPFCRSAPNIKPGVSKQFANLCGLTFAALGYSTAAAGHSTVARIFLAGLAGAAGMQSILDFCVGCVIFGGLIQFGLLPKTVYRMYINRRVSRVANWKDQNIKDPSKTSPPPVTHWSTRGVSPSPTDLFIKPRDEKDKWQVFDPVRYCHALYFAFPLSLSGLATVLKLLNESPRFNLGDTPWQVLAWIACAVFAFLLALYLAKCVVYPKKVRKESVDRIQGPALTLFGINFLLFAFLVNGQFDPKAPNFGKVLFWIGAVWQGAVGSLLPAHWVSRRWSEEMVSPGWLIPAVGGFVAALVAPGIASGYEEVGWFFFGQATLMFLALWPTTFSKAILDHHSDFRLRSSLFIWLACPAVACLAYVRLNGGDFDWLARTLFWGGAALFVQQVVAVWPLSFYDEGGFDMSSWYFVFPLDVLAAASVLYDQATKTRESKAICLMLVGIAAYTCAVIFLHTLLALLSTKLFTPLGKWSIMSYMKLTHEALEAAVSRLGKLTEQLEPSLELKGSVASLTAAWGSMCKVHDVHAMHEDDVIFPLIDSFFPGQSSPSGHEHEEHERDMAAITEKLSSLGTLTDEASRKAAVTDVQRMVPRYGAALLQHMKDEEFMYATPVVRKYFNLSLMKEVLRKTWANTPTQDMSTFICWVVNELPFTRQKVRFVKTFCWAMPERSQLIGLWLYRGCDDVTWVELSNVMPEIVPRGLPGYRRYL